MGHGRFGGVVGALLLRVQDAGAGDGGEKDDGAACLRGDHILITISQSVLPSSEGLSSRGSSFESKDSQDVSQNSRPGLSRGKKDSENTYGERRLGRRGMSR